jgi:amino acid transporter
MRKLRLAPLVAATYFMVSGGPYGLEDIVGQAGYLRALALLLIIPILWSLPTALMVGELASTLPEEGGFYVWVRRALGPFWGFQEAWLSLTASIFDMAVYPTLFVAYLSQLDPALTAGHHGVLWALAVVLVCVLWNLSGAYSVGQGSIWMFVLLLTPFVGILGFGLWHATLHPLGPRNFVAPLGGSMTTALLVTLWNYMGWDNASTVAREVDDPQRTYFLAMIAAVTIVTFSYVVPIAVVAWSGIPAAGFVTGSWVQAARMLANPSGLGRILATAVVAGGAITAIAMFNALTLSYARVPAAMAVDGYLPPIFARRMANGVPWVAVIACGIGWALALGFSFTRLLELDVMLYGLSLILEFIALIALRVREPDLHRPYRVPGGMPMAIALGACPALLIAFAIYASRDDRLSQHLPALLLGGILVALGPVLYWLRPARHTDNAHAEKS